MAGDLQRSEGDLVRLDPIDFGRRLATEKELAADTAAPMPNAIFDESGNFVLYATLLGIKVQCSALIVPSPGLHRRFYAQHL